MAVTTARHNLSLPGLDWYLMPEAYSAPLVEEAIREYGLRPGDTVLDPFSGTGTTALTAAWHGMNGLGIEANPFLAWAGRTKAMQGVSPVMFKKALSRVLDTIGPLEEAPIADLPSMPRVDTWITPKIAYKVVALREAILVEDGDSRELLLLALAAILRPVGNLKLTAHAFGTVQAKADAPVRELFAAKCYKILADLEQSEKPKGRATILHADAREIGALVHEDLPAQLAVTSPPYLNNLDYTMQTRLELFFLGHVVDLPAIKAIRKTMLISDAKAMYRDILDHERIVGVSSIQEIAVAVAEKHKDKNWGWDYPFMIRQYFGGMHRVLEGARQALAPGARFVLVVGESSHSGIKINVPALLGELGDRLGYTLEDIRVHRTRRSSSHAHTLDESSVVLVR